MSRRSKYYSLWVVLLFSTLFLLSISTVSSQRQNLAYGPRGCYSEGKQSEDVSAPKLSLISAIASGTNNAFLIQSYYVPDLLKVRFYSEPSHSASVVIRERLRSQNYWLDNVLCIQRNGSRNDFEWSTRQVIQQIGLSKRDLAVFVGLHGAKQGGSDIWVAPAIFYDNQSTPPARLTHYEFVFRSTKEVRFDFEVCRAESSCAEPLRNRSGVLVDAGTPIPARWDASRAPEGDYFIWAVALGDSRTSQKVRFHHRPLAE